MNKVFSRTKKGGFELRRFFYFLSIVFITFLLFYSQLAFSKNQNDPADDLGIIQTEIDVSRGNLKQRFLRHIKKEKKEGVDSSEAMPSTFVVREDFVENNPEEFKKMVKSLYAINPEIVIVKVKEKTSRFTDAFFRKYEKSRVSDYSVELTEEDLKEIKNSENFMLITVHTSLGVVRALTYDAGLSIVSSLISSLASSSVYYFQSVEDRGYKKMLSGITNFLLKFKEKAKKAEDKIGFRATEKVLTWIGTFTSAWVSLLGAEMASQLINIGSLSWEGTDLPLISMNAGFMALSNLNMGAIFDSEKLEHLLESKLYDQKITVRKKYFLMLVFTGVVSLDKVFGVSSIGFSYEHLLWAGGLYYAGRVVMKDTMNSWYDKIESRIRKMLFYKNKKQTASRLLASVKRRSCLAITKK